MQITAAIVPERGAEFAIARLEIEQPRAGEVLVEIAGVGLCHTDLVFRDAFIPIPWPIVLGHEGAGIVRAVGAGVTSVGPGDAVVIGFSSCGHCSRCDAHLPSYCREFVPLNYAGSRGDGSTALSLDSQPVASHFFGQSSFASHAITLERNVVKVDAAGLELSHLGPLACGLQTGAGSVMRSFDCRAGETIAVFGGGPVGLAAVMAAALRGCGRIILVEPIASRRELALEFGASDVIDPAAGDVAAAIRAILPEGVDYALETSGREAVMEAALAALASHGVLGLVGVPASAESTLSINIAGMITFGHRIIGIVEGDSDLQSFIPELIALHRAGKFPFDRLIKCFPLGEINQAIAAQHRGECVKAVLIP
jgi:aryl-alcohol dehydrogenase